jgi:hypothetical protein
MTETAEIETPLRPSDAPSSIYGADGRPVFFQDPAIDRFVAVLLNLTSELWVQTERVNNLKAFMIGKGVGSADEIDAVATAGEDDPQREAELKEFLERVLTPLREPTGR